MDKESVVTVPNLGGTALVPTYTSYAAGGHSLMPGVHLSVVFSETSTELFAGLCEDAQVGAEPVLNFHVGHPDGSRLAISGTIFQ
jgi:hypothetical protein